MVLGNVLCSIFLFFYCYSIESLWRMSGLLRLKPSAPTAGRGVVGGGGCRGWDVVVAALERLEDALTSESSTMAATVFSVGEAEQGNELDSSASSQLKSGKTLWKVSSAGVLKMPEMPGITCFS